MRYLTTLLLGWGTLVTVYALYHARYPPLVHRCPRWLRPPRRNRGTMAVCTYFVQMVAAVAPYELNLFRESVHVFAFEPFATHNTGRYCLWDQMTYVTKANVLLCTPLLYLVWLPTLVRLSRTRMAARVVATYDTGYVRCVGHLWNDWGGVAAAAAVVTASPLTSHDDLCRHINVATVCLLLTLYINVVGVVTRMLNCVYVGPKLILYYAGETRCDARWQWPYALLLGVLLCVPTYVLSVWGARRWESMRRSVTAASPPSSASAYASAASVGRWVSGATSRQVSTFADTVTRRSALVRALSQYTGEPFRSTCWHWAAVLVLQRTGITMAVSLATVPVYGAIAATLVAMVSLVLHILVRPYHDAGTNRLQTLACVCLLCICLLRCVLTAIQSTGVPVHSVELAGIVSRGHEGIHVAIVLPLAGFVVDRCLRLRNYCGALPGGWTDDEATLTVNAAESTDVATLQADVERLRALLMLRVQEEQPSSPSSLLDDVDVDGDGDGDGKETETEKEKKNVNLAPSGHGVEQGGATMRTPLLRDGDG